MSRMILQATQTLSKLRVSTVAISPMDGLTVTLTERHESRMFREEDGRRLQGPLQGRHVNGRGLRVTLPQGRCPDVTYCNRSHHSIHIYIYNIMLSSATP